MKYPFPWIAIEGLNGAGKTTLWNALKDNLALRSHFIHEPPKCGPWNEVFSGISRLEKLRRHPDVMLSYFACSLMQQRYLESQSLELLVSDRSFISTLAYFGNIDLQFRKSLSIFHKLPHGIIYLFDDDNNISERLQKRDDLEDQLLFNRFYQEGYEDVLRWIERLGCLILRIKTSSMSITSLVNETIKFTEHLS